MNETTEVRYEVQAKVTHYGASVHRYLEEQEAVAAARNLGPDWKVTRVETKRTSVDVPVVVSDKYIVVYRVSAGWWMPTRWTLFYDTFDNAADALAHSGEDSKEYPHKVMKVNAAEVTE